MANEWSKARGIRLRELDRAGLSMPGLDVTLDEKQLGNLRERLRKFPELVDTAIREASAVTSVRLRRIVVRDLVSLSTLLPKYVSKGVRSKKGLGVKSNGAEVRVASGRLPLVRYSVSPKYPPRLKGVPVSRRPRTRYRLAANGAEHNDLPYSSPGSSRLFVQTMPKTGHIGVFYRKSDGKIEQEAGPSMQYHLYADGEVERLVRLGNATLETELELWIKKMGLR